MRRLRLTFSGSQGDPLTGELDLPDDPPRVVGLLTPCFTCNKNYKGLRRIGTALAEAGLGLFRYDPTGLGTSGGEFSRTTLSTEIGDLHAAVKCLEDHGQTVSFLVGHSLGGAASLLAAKDLPTVRAVITLGTPATTGLLHRHLTSIRQPVPEGESGSDPPTRGPFWRITVGGIEFTLAQAFWDDLATHDVPAAVAALERPLLILQPEDDETVPPDQAEQLYQTANVSRSIIRIPDVGHLIARESADADRVAGLMGAWLAATLRV